MTQLATSDEPPYAMNGVTRPVTRDDPRDAADHDERLQRDDERETAREELAEPVADPDRRAEAALRQDQVAHEDRDEAGQAELLAERRDDEVRLRERHEVRASLAPARCRTGRRSPCRTGRGPAGRSRRRPCRRPRGRTRAARRRTGRRRARTRSRPGHAPTMNSRKPMIDPGQPLGGQVEHRDEQTEEEQRRAEVALEDEDGDRRGPHDEDRAEVPRPGQVQAEDLGAGQRERVAVRHQVAGEEDRERDLGELGGLEARPRRRAPRSVRR